MKIMGFDVYEGKLESIDISSKTIINTLNAHSYVVSKNDSQFKIALLNSDILLPDGVGIVLAAKQIYQKSIKKIAGSDLHKFLLKVMNNSNGKVFYMGSSIDTLTKIEKKIGIDFPNISVMTHSPSYNLSFSETENKLIIDKINAFKPDVIFVGMTAPKQEKWLEMNKELLNFKVAASIGAVFDFYAGTIKRPNKYIRYLIGESLARFLKEPKRLWRRNFISIPLFLIDILYFKLKKK